MLKANYTPVIEENLAVGEKSMKFRTQVIRAIAITFCCVLSLNTNLSAQSGNLNSAEEELNAYLSYSQIVSKLREIEAEHPQLVDLFTIGMSHGDDGDVAQSADNREILAVKISDRVDLSDDGGLQYEPDILFVGGQHAREWISVEVPLRLIEFFVTAYQSDPDVKRLLSNTELWIVPLMNPDGYEYSRNVDRMWRKNLRDNGDGSLGVDLNRNFPYPLGLRWDAPLPTGTFTSDDTNFETYRGESALSEPESQAIEDIVAAQDFKIALSFHNYGQTILYPWGVMASPAEDQLVLSEMAKTMAERIVVQGGASYRPTQSYDPMNLAGGAYLKHGEISDWLYDQGILAFTIELRPDSHHGGGFSLPVTQIDETFREMIPVALYALEYGAQQFQDEAPFKQNLSGAPIENLIDLNSNGFVDDDELFMLVDYWLSGTPLGSSQIVVDNDLFFIFLDKWSTGQPIAQPETHINTKLAISGTSISQTRNHFRLQVEGQGIERISLRVFSMSGEELLSSLQNGARLDFRLFDEAGYELANGTYLYTVTAFGQNGAVVTTQVQKFIVMREGLLNRLNLPVL